MFHPNTDTNANPASQTSGRTRRAFGDVTNSTRVNSRNGQKEQAVEKKQRVQVARKPSIILAPIQMNSVSTERHEPVLQMHNQNMQGPEGSYQYTGTVDDIDERDKNDPLCVTSYVQDMYEHFADKEQSTSVRPVYMEDQSNINERMRSILVDWLVEVHLKFKLVPETLYLTINLIDRFLEKEDISRPKLQLVGVTSLLIASKYEEIYPPELRDLVYICDHAYSKELILEMEYKMLTTLEYRITIPSAHAFLVRYLKAAHADRKIVQLSCYILDGTLQSYNLLHFLPSQLAAASVLIARKAVGRNAWSPTLLKYATYCEEDITPVARAILAEKTSSTQELRAVNKKYQSQRYGAVANTPLDWEI